MSTIPVAKVKGTMKVRHAEVLAIKEKVQQILSDKKKSNVILVLIAKLESDDTAVVASSISGLATIFSHYLNQQDMVLQRVPENNEELIGRTSEEKYKIWLRGIYGDFISRLTELFVMSKPKIQELSLRTLMTFLALEGKKPINKVLPSVVNFPAELLEKIIVGMFSKIMDTKNTVSRFEEYLEYPDVKFFSLKIINKLVKAIKSHESQDMYLYNCFTLMKSILLPVDDGENSQENLCNWDDVESAEHFKFDLATARKLYGSAWLNFLKIKLPSTLHRRVLLILDEKVLVFMESPLLLTDFLMDSYNLGGVYRILALNGIFVLMQKHNLEFPSFYEQLYSLLDDGIFHTKYCPRFFFLAHLFLSSTHLPEYLVAAFVKRFARLSLRAPPHSALLIIAFITNLLIRHRSLQKMVDRPQGPQDITEDPFIMAEADMSKCRANESSLWEMKTLQQHYNPRVAFAAGFVDKPLPRTEVDVTRFLELTTSEMLVIESKKKMKMDVPLTFTKPSGIFGGGDNVVSDLFSF